MATGHYTIVRRTASPFGAGWWVAGVDSLDIATMTVIGGGGAVQQFSAAGSDRWAALAVDRPDTIVASGSNYERLLKGGGKIVFNSSGQHIQTITPQGNVTEFTYAGGRLESIRLPVVSGSSPTYTFAYSSGYLTSVTAPGNRTTTIGRSGAVVTSIQDPGSVAVGFGSSGNRIVSRTDRRGTVTTFTYDPDTRRLTQARLDPTGLDIVTGLVAAEGRGYGSGPTAVSSVADSAAYTLLDGPRTDVVDQTRFWIDPFGAPSRVRDALSNETVLSRRHATYPALVTAVVDPAGYRDSVEYNTRGNVTRLLQINPYGTGNAITRQEYGTSGILVDYPTRIVRPAGDSMVFSYNADATLDWQQDSRGSATRTTFSYTTAKLLRSVTRPDGGTDSLAHDNWGNVIRTRTALGFATTIERDAIGRDSVVRTPINVAQDTFTTTSYTYNARGLVHQVTTSGPAMPYSCTGCYGTGGKPVPAESLTVSHLYDAEGNITSVGRWGTPEYLSSGIDMVFSGYTYDRANRKVEESHAHGQQFVYDKAGNLTEWRRGTDTVRMAYDAVNRMVVRVVPSVKHALAPCTGAVRNSPCISGTQFDSLTVPTDSQTFAYDARGNLTGAHNRYARIKRTYYPGGALQTDSIRFGTYGQPLLPGGGGGGGECEPDDPACVCEPEDPDCIPDPDFVGGGFQMMGASALPGDPYPDHWFTANRYGLTHTYDLNGRRTALQYPYEVNVSSAQTVTYSYHAWGALQYINGLTADQYAFAYDNSSQLSSLTRPGSVVEAFAYDRDGRRVRRIISGMYNDTMVYDARGKVLLASARESGHESHHRYSALGHLTLSRWNTTFSFAHNVDEFRTDPHGNIVWSKKNDGVTGYPVHERVYTPDGQLEHISYTPVYYETEGTDSYRDFNGAGGVEYASEVWTSGGSPPIHRVQSARNYYGADGRLMAVSSFVRTFSNAGALLGTDDLIQEIRYDALGRRLAQHTRHEPLCDAHCQPAIERYLWDGDQILAELRADPGTYTLEAQYSTGDDYGRIVYVHGPGIDAPLAVIRMNFNSSGPIRINPYADWRGHFDRGIAPGGALCPGASGCLHVDWPAPRLRTWLDGTERVRGNWVGSLIHSQIDQTGLAYRRNRYYDPTTGQFTQPDPIGLAGGLNLYGYAGGDPLNQDDPFGLACEKKSADRMVCTNIGPGDAEAIRDFLGAESGRSAYATLRGNPAFRSENCRGGFGGAQCMDIAQAQSWLINHSSGRCSALGTSAARRFQGGHYRYAPNATWLGLAKPVISRNVWLSGRLWGDHQGYLTDTVAHEEAHHRYWLRFLVSGAWIRHNSGRVNDFIYRIGTGCAQGGPN